MLKLSSRTANALRAVAKGMATAAPRIGDTKVPMSLLEKGAYINYQRIEDNLLVVRERYLFFSILFELCSYKYLGLTALSLSPKRLSTVILTILTTRTSSGVLATSNFVLTQVSLFFFTLTLLYLSQRVACQDATAQVSLSII